MRPKSIALLLPTHEELDGLLRYAPDLISSAPLFVSGMGMMTTAYYTGRILRRVQPDLIIHAGIAGTYREDIAIRSTVQVTSVTLADAGAEDATGRQISYHDIVPSVHRDRRPWSDGWMHQSDALTFDDIPQVSELTVPYTSGQHSTIVRRRDIGADIESMEGVGLFYACQMEQQPFISLRAISNVVAVRGSKDWDIDGALKSLAEVLERVFHEMS